MFSTADSSAGSRPATEASRSLFAICPSAITSTCLSASSSSSSCTRSNRSLKGPRDFMLVIQRPTVEAIGEEANNRQRFAVGPLEPGFGHTIGNSLRRTLLSSIPGAAVTQVRFDESLHEFATIPGVKEDVTDIILNLKDLVLTCEVDEPVTLRLDVRGPADVGATDIQTTADVEILNKDLQIATLNAKGRLALDITIARGRGYVSADRNKESTTIGIVPVDSIFSPVRRVTFDIEPTRVEMDTNYDRLVLDIETDGSITPREALAPAGDPP